MFRDEQYKYLEDKKDQDAADKNIKISARGKGDDDDDEEEDLTRYKEL